MSTSLRRRLGTWMDRLWYGARQTPAPPPTPARRVHWLAGLSPQQLLATHQHQFDGRQTTPNDCAVASMAMIIHQALWLAGYDDIRVPYPDLARAMDRAPLYGLGFYRLPFIGAVPPGRAAAALRCLGRAFVRHGHPRPWRVHLRGRLPIAQLVTHLHSGYPTLLYGAWHNGVPHAVVVAGYDPFVDRWYILDPAYPQPYDGRPHFAHWSTAFLESWWGRRYFAYQRYTAIWLTDIHRLQPVAEPEVAPHTVPLVPAA
ncbi:MAG: hypothetical protein GXO37_06020 [Chloroflexi bacterium]|nr:hypothetical protein [Chloroflexota bacterium]